MKRALFHAPTLRQTLFFALLLIIVLLLLHHSTFITSQPSVAPKINILSVEKQNTTTVFAGYLRKGFLQIPLYGYIKEGGMKAYTTGEIYGLIKKIRVFGNVAIATGNIYSFKTKNMAMLVSILFLEENKPPINLIVSSCDNSFASDALVDGDSLIVVGYTYCTLNETTGTVVHQVAGYKFISGKSGESDIIFLKFDLKNLSLVDFKLIGSPSFDDIPTLVLKRRNLYYVIGETWAYNVSQADIFVAILDQDFNIVRNFAVGGASYETPFDAIFLDDDLLITGFTTSGEMGDEGFAVLLSKIGNIKKSILLSSKGNDHLQYVSVTENGKKVIISGNGEIDEDKSDSLLITLNSADWNIEKFELVRAIPDNDTLIFMSKDGKLIIRTGRLRLVDLADKVAYCLSTNCSDSQIVFLDDRKESNIFLKKIASWRTSYNILKEKSLAGNLHVDTMPSTPYNIKLAKSSVSIKESIFQRQIDWRKRLIRSLEQNVPILLILPIPVGFVIVYIIAKRGSRSEHH